MGYVNRDTEEPPCTAVKAMGLSACALKIRIERAGDTATQVFIVPRTTPSTPTGARREHIMPDASFQARKAKYGRLAGYPRQTLNADDARSAVFLAAEQRSRRNGVHRDENVTPTNVAKWVTAARRLERFVAQLRRFPRETVSGEERTSAIWVRYQRRKWDQLCGYQKDWLESIPGFYRDPLGEQVDAQVGNYNAVVEKIHRAPKRTSDDPAEVRAARWATKQRMLYRQGKLPKHRVDELSELKYWWWQK